MPPEAEPQEKLNALTESQRPSARTAAKPRQLIAFGCRIAALHSLRLPLWQGDWSAFHRRAQKTQRRRIENFNRSRLVVTGSIRASQSSWGLTPQALCASQATQLILTQVVKTAASS